MGRTLVFRIQQIDENLFHKGEVDAMWLFDPQGGRVGVLP